MKIDVVQIKQMILNQIVKDFSGGTQVFNKVSENIDDAILKLKIIQFNDNGEVKALSLTSISSMGLFTKDGEFDFIKASELSLKLKSEVQELLQQKPYGNISARQTLALDVLIQSLLKQLQNQLKSQMNLISEQQRNFNPQYIELQKSIDELDANLKLQLQEFLKDSLEFKTAAPECLALSTYSQILLQGGVFAIADVDSKLDIALPAKEQADLTAEQLNAIILNSDKNLNIINLENISSATNYFIPDQYGNVELDKKFQPLTATSQLVAVVGKLHAYQVHFSNGVNINVTHLPFDANSNQTLTQAEIVYLKDEHSKIQHRTLIHGGRGSELIKQIAYCHAPSIVDVDYSSNVKFMLGSDKEPLDTDTIDNAFSSDGFQINNQSRLWREIILSEIAKAKQKLEAKPAQALSKRLELLNDLLQQINLYQLPKVAEIKIDGAQTINDLAKYLLLERAGNLEQGANVEWSWLIDMAVCPDGQVAILSFADFEKDLNCQSELVGFIVKAKSILSLLKALDITEANKTLLLEELPLVINRLSKKIESIVLTKPLDNSNINSLKIISATLLNAVNVLNEKFDTLSLELPSDLSNILNDSKNYIRGTQLLLINSDLKSVVNYQIIQQVYLKLLKCLEQAEDEQLLPKQWLAKLDLTEIEINISNLAPMALEPCINYIETLQQQEAYNSEHVFAAKQYLESGIKLLKAAVIKHYMQQPNFNLQTKTLDASFQENKKLTQLFVPNLDLGVDKEKLFNARQHNRMIKAISANEKRNEQENKGGKKYQYFENSLLKLIDLLGDEPIPLFYDSSKTFLQLTDLIISLEVNETGKKFPVSFMSLLLDEEMQPLINQLDVLAKQYNDLEGEEEKKEILNNYKRLVVSVISDIEVTEKRSERLNQMQGEILKSKKDNKLFYTKQKSSNLHLISKSIPQLIMLDVELIAQDELGELNDPLLVEWLLTAQAAGSQIALVSDNEHALQQAQKIINGFNQCHLSLVGNFDLSKSTPESLMLDLESNLGLALPQIDKKKCLLIDKVRSDLEVVNYLREPVELNDLNKVDFSERDKLLHRLAFRFDYLSEHIDYLNGVTKTNPLTSPFGYQSQGFLNSLLVASVSIENFTKNIVNWLQGFLVGTKIEINLDNDKKILADFFNQRQNTFIESEKNSEKQSVSTTIDSKLNFSELFNIARINIDVYQEMISDVSFRDILNEVFKSEHPSITSLSRYDLMSILNNVYQQYLSEKELPLFNYKVWFGPAFQMQLIMHTSKLEYNENKKSNKISAKSEIDINDFVFCALKCHKDILLADPDIANKNIIAASQNCLDQAKFLIDDLSNDIKLHSLTTVELSELYNKLNLELNKLELYLNIDTDVEKGSVEVAYNQLYIYKHIIFDSSGAEIKLFIGDDFNSNLIGLYQTLKHPVLPVDYQAVSNENILKANEDIITIKQQQIYLDINQQKQDHLQRFFNLDFVKPLNELILTQIVSDFNGLIDRAAFYDKNINDIESFSASPQLHMVLDLLNLSSNENQSLLTTLLVNWQEDWSDDFKEQAKIKIYSTINQKILTLEQKFIRANNDLTKSKPSLEDLLEVEHLIKTFKDKFGLHFDSVRLERLKTLIPLQAKYMPIYMDNNYLLLEPKYEILFLRKYMKQISQAELNLKIDSQLSDVFNAPNLNSELNNSKQQYEEHFITPYLGLLLAQAIDCLDLDEQSVDSGVALINLIELQATAKITEKLSLMQLNELENLMTNVVIFNSKYSSIYGESLIQTESFNVLHEKISQKASQLFLEQLKQELTEQTVSSKWNFSWFELSVWGSQQQININVDGEVKLFSLPKAVKEQYELLTEFLESDVQDKNYSGFKGQMLQLSEVIKSQLATDRSNIYATFFKEAGVISSQKTINVSEANVFSA